ncbi:hypothetical protein JCGZ_25778 [Jatropha curcas]|uniref:Protein kinase domain-containing protein n=1 Tax=Jatropha curcas TaxID=180498 RepID=A0A067JJH5_JATCU|nr:hypothetical protein JCGZ_25778 [Jatropha curcas]
MFTNGFSEGNLMWKFQFGKLFWGKINERKVIVKIWEYPEMYKVFEGDNEGRVRDEIELLQHPKLIGHPNLVKLVGYCYDEQQLGTVYDLDPLGSVYELAPKGCFTWLHRIKVAYEFACLLKFLHIRNPPYESCLVRSIDAAHIMLDKEYTPE